RRERLVVDLRLDRFLRLVERERLVVQRFVQARQLRCSERFAVIRIPFRNADPTHDRGPDDGPRSFSSRRCASRWRGARLKTDLKRMPLAEATSREHRRSRGVYYTPRALVDALLDHALDPAIDAALRSPEPADALGALRVLDPACGDGAFLVA